MTAFYKWFTTFIEEKDLDLSEVFNNSKGQMLQIGDVVQAICWAPANEQAAIKQKIVQIDFKNGDVSHFLRHLGNAVDPDEIHKQMVSNYTGGSH